MKKTIIAFLLSLLALNTSFAKTLTLNKIYGEGTWKLSKGELIRFVAMKPLNITVYVNSLIRKDSKHALVDWVTLDCDGLISKITPGSSNTCTLKEVGRHADVYIAETDFQNGAEGTYNFEQLNKK